MNKHISDFHKQTIIYKERFGTNYAKHSWHTLMYLLRNWFGPKHNYARSGKHINIGFIANGGIGDIVMFGAYLDKFIQQLDCEYKIHIFVQQSIDDIRTLFNEYRDCTTIQPHQSLKKTPLDLLISFNVQFPEVYFYRQKFIEKKSKFLPNYLESIIAFCNKYSHIFETERIFNQQIMLDIMGLNRITGMDPTKKISLGSNDTMTPPTSIKTDDTLKKFGLSADKFITFAYSIDILNTSETSTRLWPAQHLQSLIHMLKAAYPEYKIVQLGTKSLSTFTDTDLNLVGKTTFSELLGILSTSKLHLDSECGMVHLRHALCGKRSVVLHGPTSISTKGYTENINISSNICNCACCECLTNAGWEKHCIKTDSAIPACMQAITPELVFEKISGVL